MLREHLISGKDYYFRYNIQVGDILLVRVPSFAKLLSFLRKVIVRVSVKQQQEVGQFLIQDFFLK